MPGWSRASPRPIYDVVHPVATPVLRCLWQHVKVFYWVVKYTLGMSLKLVFRPWSRGRRYVPRRGSVILASNHLSFADHFFGPLPVPRKVVFLAKAEYFTKPGLTGLLPLLGLFGTVRTNREQKSITRRGIPVIPLLGLLLFISSFSLLAVGCGTTGQTPASQVNLTVIGTSGTIVQSTPVAVTIN